MSKAKYSEIRKKQPGGRYVWGVLQMEGRKQKFQTVGEGEGARRKAKKLAQRLVIPPPIGGTENAVRFDYPRVSGIWPHSDFTKVGGWASRRVNQSSMHQTDAVK
jgi:hypothetical protein